MGRTEKLLIAAVLGLAAIAPAAYAVPLVTTNGTTLSRFDSDSLDVVTNVPVSGMQGGETLVGIDARPVDGQLYGVGTTSRLYHLNPDTGRATLVGAAGFAPALNGTSFGTDFNPVPDRLRVVSNTEQNLRLNPNPPFGAVNDSPLNPAGNVVAAGYTNNYAGATTTTLFDIDSAAGTLVVQTNPNAGTLQTVGSLGLGGGLDETIGLEITPTNTLFAAITAGGSFRSRLYTIDPNTGVATLLDKIASGATSYVGLALYHPTTARAVDQVQGTEGGTATVIVNRLGSGQGTLSVDYATAPGTATTSDFTPASGTLTWQPEDKSAKVISIPIAQDQALEEDESFTVTLSNAVTAPVTKRGFIPAPAGATVTIPKAGQQAPPPATTPTPVGPVNTAPPTPGDRQAPALGGSGPVRQRLRAVLVDGVGFRITSSELCALDATLGVPAATARRLRLPARLGTLKTALRPGPQTVRVRPTRAAAVRLRRVRRVAVRLTGACVDAAGNRSAVSRSVTLRR